MGLEGVRLFFFIGDLGAFASWWVIKNMKVLDP